MEQLAKKCGLMITQGKKGKPKLLYAGFAYFRNNSKGPKTYWLCAKNRDNRCRARIITCSMTGELMIKNQNHNHPAPSLTVIQRGKKRKNVLFSLQTPVIIVASTPYVMFWDNVARAK